MNTFEYLTNWDIELVKKIVKHLNDFGVISDEDSYGISSTLIEKWSDSCTDYLIQHGYEGGHYLLLASTFRGMVLYMDYMTL